MSTLNLSSLRSLSLSLSLCTLAPELKSLMCLQSTVSNFPLKLPSTPPVYYTQSILIYISCSTGPRNINENY